MTVDRRIAIIDIGSNSVRLVVYGGPERAPVTLYNEKLLAGLGRNLHSTGRLSKKAMSESTAALMRFRDLTRLMDVDDVRVVATAAVRDAENSADFIAMVKQIGLQIEILSGEEEARASGFGVISGAPQADGIVGDLGGGSLELVRIKNGQVHENTSLPLGTLRVAGLGLEGRSALESYVHSLLKPHLWLSETREIPFYLVGGSWRSLARYHIFRSGYPLPVLTNYLMQPEAAEQILRWIPTLDKLTIRQIPTMSSARLPMLNDAAMLLAVITKVLKPSALISCGYGLREGLLYESLSDEKRALDPLIVSARFEGERLGRFGVTGDSLFAWVAPLFEKEASFNARICHASCLLADTVWSTNPEFRPEHGLEMALHGNWIGVTPRDRAMLGMAVYASLGGGIQEAPALTELAMPEELASARRWGLALRLGQRIGGGTDAALRTSRLTRSDDIVRLELQKDHAALLGDSVFRRLKQLANALDCVAEMVAT